MRIRSGARVNLIKSSTTMNPSQRLDYSRGTPKLPIDLEWKSTAPNDPIRFLRLKPGVHVRTQNIRRTAPRDPYALVPDTTPGVYPFKGVVPAKAPEMRTASESFYMLDHCVPATLTDSEPTPDFDEHRAANFNIVGVDLPDRKGRPDITTCTGEGPEKCAYCLASSLTKDAMDRAGAKY